MLRVVTAADGFEARVIAARLGAEGIVWELRGSVDGPLALGTVDVLVTEADYGAARDVLGSEPTQPPTGPPTHHDGDRYDGAARAGAGRVERWVLAAVVVLAVAAFALARMGARV